MEGDVMLAGALGDIVRHLRWDPTEDLSRYTGDIAAERITGLARRAVGAVFDAGKRVESNAAHYLSVESGQLVDEASLEMLAAQIDALERRVDALSGRVRSPGLPPGPWSG
jgi:ubiquinone biosynthesis protein UbiJ